MARLILHIGTHKTATTTLQRTFKRNRALLAERGVIYPEIGASAGHHALVTHWFDMPQFAGLDRPIDAAWRTISERYAGTDATVVLSSEEFSRGDRDRRVDFTELRALVSDFEDVKVLCLLREQAAFLQSIFLQMAKSHRQVGMYWREFYDKTMKTRLASGLFLNYNQLYDHILTGFAPEEIIFLSYDAACRAPGGVIGKILEMTGAPLTADDLDHGPPANVSPEPLSFWAARMIAGGHQIRPELLDAVGQAIRRQFGEDCRTTIFNASELRAVINHFDAANRRFVERVAEVQPEFVLPPSRLTEDHVDRGQLTAGFWMTVARMVYAESMQSERESG
ncbi:hypothetical protein Ga0609869_002030 [Rhodovulum iodosum]|uniref:Sulfotransferase domain-containing protein n=1 Tax=Rhodovulum iodosum TaxID=68291 RepID=A0ABV3XTM1_9RHOB|nr:sulfotransferase domain-containing protein [Rhodovulum robiginosum]RSK32123.1 hypothetical protein EJA01_12925 [Rhodovulum robiginosum]